MYRASLLFIALGTFADSASASDPKLTLRGNRVYADGERIGWGKVKPMLLDNPGSKRLAQSARRRTTAANLVPLAFLPLAALGVAATIENPNDASGATLVTSAALGSMATTIPLSIGATRQWKRAVDAYEPVDAPMDSVQAYLDHRVRGLQLCRADATGRVEIEVAVRKGVMEDPRVVSDNTGAPGIAECMLERMRSWTIPSHLTGVGTAVVVLR